MLQEDKDIYPKRDLMLADDSVVHNVPFQTYKLVLYKEIRTLTLLSADVPDVLEQQQFTRNEWNILMAIIESLPYYTPYEVLLSRVTSLSVEDSRKRLQKAEELGAKVMRQELKPVHRALSGIRAKLSAISPYLKLSLIHSLGYTLTTPLKMKWHDK